MAAASWAPRRRSVACPSVPLCRLAAGRGLSAASPGFQSFGQPSRLWCGPSLLRRSRGIPRTWCAPPRAAARRRLGPARLLSGCRAPTAAPGYPTQHHTVRWEAAGRECGCPWGAITSRVLRPRGACAGTWPPAAETAPGGCSGSVTRAPASSASAPCRRSVVSRSPLRAALCLPRLGCHLPQRRRGWTSDRGSI